MENSPELDTCCVICSKTGNNSHLLPVVANTADAVNKHLNQLFNIEIVRTGNGDHRICVSCLYIVKKAAKLKDCLRDRETIFKKTSEKVQEPNQDPVGLTITNTNEITANKSPGCLKTTQSELMCVEIGSAAEYGKQRAGVEIAQNESHCYGRRLKVPNKNDRLKRGLKCDDEKPAPVPTVEKENTEDNLEGSPKKLSENVDVSVTSNKAKVHEDNDIEMMTIAGDEPRSSVTAGLYEEHDDHAPEIEVCNADALDDFLNNNVVEDSKSGGSSKEFAQAGLQHSKTDEQLRRCSLSCDLKSESEVESDPAMYDDDTSLDYVANFKDSAAGSSTSSFSMLTRSRRSQQDSNLAIRAVDPNPYRLLMSDKSFKCDHCPEVFYYKYTLLKHLMVHINYQQPYRCNWAGCTKSYSTKRSLTRHHSDCHTDKLTTREPAMKQLQERKKVPKKMFACSFERCQKSYKTRRALSWHQKSIHSGPRFTSVKQQQQTGCASTDPASSVLTSTENEIERVEEEEQIRFIAIVQPTLGYTILVEDEPKSPTKVKIQRAEEPKASTSMAAIQYKESIDFVQPMSSLSANSETTKSKRKSHGSFMCCKKDFETSANKLKHMEIAHDDRKQICDECGKVFYQTYQLECHMKDHTNIRQFRCPFEGCIKSYDSASNLGDHKRKIHSADDRLKCFCGFEAISQPVFKEHQRKCGVGNSKLEKQAEGPPSAEQKVRSKAERNVELTRFGCDFQGCDESFVTTAELNQHALSHAENSDRVESLPSSTVKALPTFECSFGYKPQNFDEFQKHYEFGCPR